MPWKLIKSWTGKSEKKTKSAPEEETKRAVDVAVEETKHPVDTDAQRRLSEAKTPDERSSSAETPAATVNKRSTPVFDEFAAACMTGIAKGLVEHMEKMRESTSKQETKDTVDTIAETTRAVGVVAEETNRPDDTSTRRRLPEVDPRGESDRPTQTPAIVASQQEEEAVIKLNWAYIAFIIYYIVEIFYACFKRTGDRIRSVHEQKKPCLIIVIFLALALLASWSGPVVLLCHLISPCLFWCFASCFHDIVDSAFHSRQGSLMQQFGAVLYIIFPAFCLLMLFRAPYLVLVAFLDFCLVCACPEENPNKSSAVAETGDRARAKWAEN